VIKPGVKGGKPVQQLCLVMTAAERSLDQIISAERIAGLDVTAIKAFGMDIGRALQYLHGQNVVHGDFKPRNIVRMHGVFKLIDFDASVRVPTKICQTFLYH
jgi:serine/threonine protein kinase